ncbi:hypothetical protein [Nocardia sp. NPDC004722]
MVALFFKPGPRIVEAARCWLTEEADRGRWPWPDIARGVADRSDAEALDAIDRLYHPWPADVVGLRRFVEDFYADRELDYDIEPHVERRVLLVADEFAAVVDPPENPNLAAVVARLRKAGLPQLFPASLLRVNGANR